MENMQQIEQALDSREVAEMVEKEHRFLLRDIRRYVTQFNQCNLAPVKFFQESTYKDHKGETRPCYQITKKGCEFISHKLTGIRGTEFTYKYINRFHEMQQIISNQKQTPEFPWFIRKFRGRNIILERDFISITGVDIRKHKLFYRMEYFKGGLDFNGWGWKCDNEEFKKEYGFDYGDDPCMMYFYPCGVSKALRILASDRSLQQTSEACKLLTEGLNMIHVMDKKEKRLQDLKPIAISGDIRKGEPVQINIVVRGVAI